MDAAWVVTLNSVVPSLTTVRGGWVVQLSHGAGAGHCGGLGVGLLALTRLPGFLLLGRAWGKRGSSYDGGFCHVQLQLAGSWQAASMVAAILEW